MQKRKRRSPSGKKEGGDRRLPRKKSPDHVLGPNEIHKLPDSLLIAIISELPIKDAVRTSVLSRRWKNLWKWTTSIKFDNQLGSIKCHSNTETYLSLQSKRLATVAKRVFSSHLGHISSCRILHYAYNCDSDIAQWLEHLSKRGIQKLALICHDESGWPHNRWDYLHSTGVRCSSLQVLELSSWVLKNVTPLMGFCNLTTLTLRCVFLKGKTLMDIISTCVALEWLALLRCNSISLSTVKIHAPNLKGLELKCLSSLENIDIDAPSLTTLAISSVSFKGSIKINVPNIQLFRTDDVSEERIDDEMGINMKRVDEAGTSMKRKLESCNSNMDFLSQCVGLYGVSCRNWFENLQKLSIDIDLTNIRHDIVLAFVLRNCIHIQVLDLGIKQYSAQFKSESSSTLTLFEYGYWSKVDASDCSDYNLKTVTMNGFVGEPLELDFANHLITRAPGLQKMTIRCDKYCSEAHALTTRSVLLNPTLNLNIVIGSAYLK